MRYQPLHTDHKSGQDYDNVDEVNAAARCAQQDLVFICHAYKLILCNCVLYVMYWIYSRRSSWSLQSQERTLIMASTHFIFSPTYGGGQYQHQRDIIDGDDGIIQLMFGINLFALIVTTIKLIVADNDFDQIRVFLTKNPLALPHVISMIGVVSAIIQLCTFYLIKELGLDAFAVFILVTICRCCYTYKKKPSTSSSAERNCSSVVELTDYGSDNGKEEEEELVKQGADVEANIATY